MIIDTKKLQEKINDYYANRSEIADKIKNDVRACQAFTRLETEQLRDEELLQSVIALAERLDLNEN